MSETNGQASPKKYVLRCKEVSIQLEDSTGAVKDYVIRELKGPMRDSYLEMVEKQTRRDKAGNPISVSSTGLIEAMLQMTLFSVPEGKQLGLPIIREFPSSVQMDLYVEAMRLSGLNPAEAKETAKND